MKKKMNLYGRILLVGFISMFINLIIMSSICPLCGLYTLFYGILIFIPGLIIGFIIFFFILRSRFEKYIIGRNINVVCVFVAVVIIAPAFLYYYSVVPPTQVTNQWHYDSGQNISKVLYWMGIHYDRTYTTKGGYFYLKGNQTQGNEFTWTYNEPTRVITMTEELFGEWTLSLRLDIAKVNGNYYIMTTHYVSNQNFTLFDPLLFDNTTWKGSLLWEDQGRQT